MKAMAGELNMNQSQVCILSCMIYPTSDESKSFSLHRPIDAGVFERNQPTQRAASRVERKIF